MVDSNALQSPELRAFLARSPSRFAVLNDYASMEAYKGNTLVSIYRSMEILAQFPRQVIILRTTGRICGLRGRTAGLQRRMIDMEQTGGFPDFCRLLRAAQHGDSSIQRQLLENGRAADEQMDRILADAPIMSDVIKEFSKEFTPEELILLRHSFCTIAF